MTTTLTAPGARQVTTSFSPHAASVRAARQFVSDRLEGTDVDLDLALLLTSELASNAVVHARTPFEVVVTLGADWCRIGVVDRSPEELHPGGFSTTATGGRGLRMMHALSDRSGCDRLTRGKVVWFELRRDR